MSDAVATRSERAADDSALPSGSFAAAPLPDGRLEVTMFEMAPVDPASTVTPGLHLVAGWQKIIEVRVKDMMEKGLRFQDVTLQPGDIVVTPESFF